MARGGGRGGGSRGGGSFGGSRGGGRSFGGSRGGGSRLGGGPARGRGGSNRNTGGGFNRPTPRRRYYGGFPPFLGGYGLGRSSRRRRRYHRGGGGCGGCAGGGCFSSILTIILLLFAFNFIWGMMPGNSNQSAVETVQINSSTIEREPIEKGLVNETAYYDDHLDWIKNPNELQSGLRDFYKKTNIQPFVYITDNIAGDPNPTPAEIDAFANSLYDEIFTDEAHLLLVHFENYDAYQYEYSYHTVYGSQAKVVMDDEAEDILFDFLDYHYQRDITNEQFYSEAFRDTAERIMTVTRSPWIPALIVVGVAVILLVLFNWWRNALSKTDTAGESAKAEPSKNDSDFDNFDF